MAVTGSGSPTVAARTDSPGRRAQLADAAELSVRAGDAGARVARPVQPVGAGDEQQELSRAVRRSLGGRRDDGVRVDGPVGGEQDCAGVSVIGMVASSRS